MATVAKKGNGVFINSPDLFQFEYVSGGENNHPFLNKFKIGVLENVSSITPHPELMLPIKMELLFI